MKKQILLSLAFLSIFACPVIRANEPGGAPTGWAIIASYTIPGKASGLAWDGTYIYFGIYGANGNNVYRFNPQNGTNSLLCTGSFEDAYGMTYKSPNLVTVNQPSSSSNPSTALEFNMSGTTVSNLTLPDHYMSGIAWDNGNWWVCTYYPDPGVVYHLNSSGGIISQFTPPANQPWDICLQGSDLWIADYYGNALFKVTTTGTLIESHPTANVNPAGIVFDGTYLWYCDGPLGGNSTLYKVDLTGSGTPNINVPVDEHDYGAIAIGSSSSWNCMVENTGTANLNITEIEIPSGQPISTTFSVPHTITPGSSASIPLKFAPTSASPLNTNVIIHSSDPIDPEVSVHLTGNGVYAGPHINVSGTYHNYGTRRAGAYTRWSLPITNDGSQNLIISEVSINDTNFFIDQSVNLPITIGTLNTYELPIWFNPPAQAAYSGILSISSNSITQSTLTYDLMGAGEKSYYGIGTVLWSHTISGDIDVSPKCILPIEDITGDGISDVIVGSEDNYIRCFNGNASITADILWEVEIYAGAVYQQNSIVQIDDINNDGYKDIIVGTAWGDESVVALSGKTGQQLWKHTTDQYGDGGWIYQVDAKFDYNTDGFPDVLAASGDDANDTGPKRVYCLDGKTGASIWEKPLGGPVFSVLGVNDLNGDSKPDVVAGSSNADETIGSVYALNGTSGQQLWNHPTAGSSVWGLMELDDINDDGRPDIAAGDFSGNLLFLNGVHGLTIHQISIGNVLILRLVDMGDVNKNGFRDVLVAHSGTNAKIIDGSTCQAIWSKPLSDKSWCVANIGDISWEGTNDAIIGTLYQNNNAYFLNGYNGNTLFTYPTNDPVDAINAIPDITDDNSMEMVYGDRYGVLACLSGGFDSTTINTENLKPEILSFEIFPNPNRGKFQIKIDTDVAMNIQLRIIDIKGIIVDESETINLTPGTNVFNQGNFKSLDSGVYILEIFSNKGFWHKKLIIN